MKSSTYDYNQSPLYKITSKKKLAAVLYVTLGDLKKLQLLAHQYRRVWKHKIQKRVWRSTEPTEELSKQYRPIDIPPDDLKLVQQRIASLFSRIHVPENVYNPVKGKSYIDNAYAHRNSESVYSLDIKNYFPSTSKEKVIGFFKNQMKCSIDVSVILANIVSKDGGLPQGSSCSPALAYHANKQMWDLVTSLSHSYECIATIYADDLTISGNVVPKSLRFEVSRIIKKYGLSEQEEKIQSSYKRPTKITGVIVKDGKLLLPNSKHKLIKETKDLLLNARNPDLKKKLTQKLKSRHLQRQQIEDAN